MRIRTELAIFASVALSFPVIAAFAQSARVNSPAPDFRATDSRGQSHSLDQYKGKYVVLEWHNQGCPFTRKHYDSGSMRLPLRLCLIPMADWAGYTRPGLRLTCT